MHYYYLCCIQKSELFIILLSIIKHLYFQFLTWFAGVEAEMCEEQDSPYRDYVSQLEGHRTECHTLLAQLDEALENLQHLSSQVCSCRQCKL